MTMGGSVIHHGPAALLDAYAPGETTLISSPGGATLAHGEGMRVPPAAGRDQLRSLAVRAQETLSEAVHEGLPPVLVGALPFHPSVAPHLVVPRHVTNGPPLRAWPGESVASVLEDLPSRHPVPEPREFANRVARAVSMLRAGDGLDKVVLARALELRGAEPDIPALLSRLAAADPSVHVFAIDLPTTSDAPRTLVGASPETLLRRMGDTVESLPLAGSARRAADPVEDARRGAALLCSAKDREEHAVVTRAIADALTPLCSALDIPDSPELVRTRAMWHLATRIRGRLADRSITSLDLATALHPTPAVCGTPRERARQAITELEPIDRGYYAGAVGWQEITGDGEWIVAIRCGEIEGDTVRLWAGAGLVQGSDPDGELAETTAKFGTLLSAIGLESAQ